MKKLSCCLLLALHGLAAGAQIHVGKLVIKKGETFSFGISDILVADTLIMEDASGIELNRSTKENFLHAKLALIGTDCFINGKGSDGKVGKNGAEGSSVVGPCRSGTIGKNGTAGTDAANGVDLQIYFTNVVLKGKLTITLTGGNGGNGGQGGEGGDGGNGTNQCAGGNGGNGGLGGNGGNGGNGGTLAIHTPEPLVTVLRGFVIVKNSGGLSGEGGRGGYSGYGGTAPATKARGKAGIEGASGEEGLPGKNGAHRLSENKIAKADK